MKHRGHLLCLTALLLLPLLHLYADDASDLRERLHQAELSGSLDTAGTKPWHLTIDFQIMGGKSPTQTGTIDEWWAGPDLWKIVYAGPALTWTEIKNEQGLFRSTGKDEPLVLAEMLLEQVVHPISQERSDEERLPSIERKQLGQFALDCIKLSVSPTRNPHRIADSRRTYCLDRDSSSLRVSSSFETEVVVRTKLGTFLTKRIALEQNISFNGVLAASSHVVKLQTESLSAPDFAPGIATAHITDERTSQDTQLTGGFLIEKLNPVYPYLSKTNHISGTVLLRATIGVDGHVRSIREIYAPSPDLSTASIEAVRHWTYEPFISDGHPVAIVSEIGVRFTIGPEH